jgi:thymidylate synthase ThyX
MLYPKVRSASETMIETMTEHSKSESAAAAPEESARNRTEVFAVHGADPEVLAYAMAKYSRSALSMKESLKEISSQRAEQFLNTFYFQYGHRSIADLAHIAFAVERLSLLAAIVLVDEQRWDGQERSTRYQNFRKSGWYLPEFGAHSAERERFVQTVESLFGEYHAISEKAFEFLQGQIARPEGMKEDSYARTLRARAFDVARYLLPLATNTSLGQIVNARTLEQQISRLLTDPHPEVRELGEQLRKAAAGAAWNVEGEQRDALQREIAALDPALGARSEQLLCRESKTAPTLVKYAAASEYARKTRSDLADAAASLMNHAAIAPPGTLPDGSTAVVDLLDDEPLEIEIAATLLYGACHYPYRQIRDRVAALDETRRSEIIALGARHRGRHDELLREFSSGHALRFDILMDIGGFRDMHRHRRCVQILQPFTNLHGYEIPALVADAGLVDQYRVAMNGAVAAFGTLAAAGCDAQAAYALPLGVRNRALFKMDFAEALYIAELRSGPAGHFSYRQVAWQMYRAVAKKHPSLASYFRVADIHTPVDLLQR